MKKLLGIVVLGLLLSSCSSSRISDQVQIEYMKSKIIYSGMKFSEFKQLFNWPNLRWEVVTPYYLHASNASYLGSPYNIENISYAFFSAGARGEYDNYILNKSFNNNLEAVEYYLSKNDYDQKLLKYKLIIQKTRAQNKSRNVNTTDQKIAYAKSVCRSVGYTPGTNDFKECTIKIITAPGGQQTVVVGSGNNQRLLRPYPLGCRSMGGNWNC